jgi:hypothetical protein
MKREQLLSRKMRLLMVGALLIALTASYLVILRNFNVSEQPGERMFGAAGSVAAARIYLEPLSIDAANEGMQLRDVLGQLLYRDAGLHAPDVGLAQHQLVEGNVARGRQGDLMNGSRHGKILRDGRPGTLPRPPNPSRRPAQPSSSVPAVKPESRRSGTAPARVHRSGAVSRRCRHVFDVVMGGCGHELVARG